MSHDCQTRLHICYTSVKLLGGMLAQVSMSHQGKSSLSPADLSGWLVEPGAHSLLPVFVKVRVQDHSIPAGGHGCLLPCNTAWHTGMSRLSCRHTIIALSATYDAKLAVKWTIRRLDCNFSPAAVICNNSLSLQFRHSLLVHIYILRDIIKVWSYKTWPVAAMLTHTSTPLDRVSPPTQWLFSIIKRNSVTIFTLLQRSQITLFRVVNEIDK